MKSYVEQVARIFDGVRLDNCHSTPIPVSKHLHLHHVKHVDFI